MEEELTALLGSMKDFFITTGCSLLETDLILGALLAEIAEGKGIERKDFIKKMGLVLDTHRNTIRENHKMNKVGEKSAIIERATGLNERLKGFFKINKCSPEEAQEVLATRWVESCLESKMTEEHFRTELYAMLVIYLELSDI